MCKIFSSVHQVKSTVFGSEWPHIMHQSNLRRISEDVEIFIGAQTADVKYHQTTGKLNQNVKVENDIIYQPLISIFNPPLREKDFTYGTYCLFHCVKIKGRIWIDLDRISSIVNILFLHFHVPSSFIGASS